MRSRRLTRPTGWDIRSNSPREHPTALREVQFLPGGNVSFPPLLQELLCGHLLLVLDPCLFQLVLVGEDLDRLAGLDGAVAHAVGHVVRGLEPAEGVDVPVAPVGHPVWPTVLVVELPVGAHLVPELVGVAVEVLLEVLGLVAVFYRYYYFLVGGGAVCFLASDRAQTLKTKYNC